MARCIKFDGDEVRSFTDGDGAVAYIACGHDFEVSRI